MLEISRAINYKRGLGQSNINDPSCTFIKNRDKKYVWIQQQCRYVSSMSKIKARFKNSVAIKLNMKSYVIKSDNVADKNHEINNAPIDYS